MIQRLKLWGFKSIGPEGLDLPLAPITLLLGENSIGKSSVFHSLLALQQSWDEFASVGRFCAVGAGVDLGRFSNVQYRTLDYLYSEVGLSIEETSGKQYAFCWDAPGQQEIPPTEQSLTTPPVDWPEFWRLAAPPVDEGLLRVVQAGQFEFQAKVEPEGLHLTLNRNSIDCWLEEHPDTLIRKALQAGAGFVWLVEFGEKARLEPYVDFVSIPDPSVSGEEKFANEDAARELQALVSSSSERGKLWTDATLALESLGQLRAKVRSICHLGGIRHRGKRIYEVRTGTNPWSVGPTGENIVDLLVHHPGALERTNRLLDLAGANYHVHLSDPTTQAKIRELLLLDLREGPTAGNIVGLPDVGTGISQMLPIAVQIAVFMQPQSFSIDPLLLIEQPELHLHPKLQARMVRMLSSAVNLDFDGNTKTHDRPVQFLIETHSEHLVSALSVQVEKGALKPDSISLLKLTRDQERQALKVARIRLADDGRFQDTWPDGFFPERENLEDGKLP